MRDDPIQVVLIAGATGVLGNEMVRRLAGSAAFSHAQLLALRYRVPATEQPVRALKVSQFLAIALELAPPGIHVAAPETVWRAAQGDMRAAVSQWLGL